MRSLFLCLLLLTIACKTESKKPKPALQETLPSSTNFAEIKTPDQLLGPLFKDVQLAGVFEDSKTFVDCIAKYPYDTIRARYAREKDAENFDLKTFVLRQF